MTIDSQVPILKILNEYKRAVYEKNVDLFSGLYDKNLLAFDMWGPNWKYQGVQSWTEMAQDWFKSIGTERVVVDFDDIQVKMSVAMAWVSAYVKYSAVSAEGTELRSLQNRMTCVLEQINGSWKITHEHTSGPIDPNTLKVSLKRI
jgi:ketosteroid isomerase-like protein